MKNSFSSMIGVDSNTPMLFLALICLTTLRVSWISYRKKESERALQKKILYVSYFCAFKFRLAPTWYEGMLHVQFSHVCADLGPRWSSVGPLGPISVFPLSSHSWARADDGQAADNGHLVSGQ